MREWIAPALVDFAITGKCNLSCLICNLVPREAVPMDTPTVLKTISHLDDIHLQILDILGGEPLMRKDWWEITEHVTCNTDVALIFSTNGVLWNHGDVKRMAAQSGDIEVAVSLDGPTPPVHGEIRAPGNKNMWEKIFSRTVGTIQEMVENNVPVCVNFVLTSLNAGTVFETFAMLQSMGVESLNIIRFYPVGRGYTHHAELDVPYRVWAQFVQDLADYSIKTGTFGNITVLTHFWEIFLPLCEVYGRKKAIELTKKVAHPCSGPLDSLYRRKMTSVGCNAGITQAYIDFDGTVYPCGLIPRYEEVTCGNVMETEFKDIWLHSPMLNRIRSYRAADIPGCAHCEYLDICGGGCRGRALALSGDFFGPDRECPLTEGLYHEIHG